MTFSELIGSAGVLLLLTAFWLNLTGRMDRNSYGFLVLNATGALLASFASWLIGFLPFVVLEGTWALAALIALIKKIIAAL